MLYEYSNHMSKNTLQEQTCETSGAIALHVIHEVYASSPILAEAGFTLINVVLAKLASEPCE